MKALDAQQAAVYYGRRKVFGKSVSARL